MQSWWSVVGATAPQRPRFPTRDEVLAEAARRDVDRAYRDLLRRRAEASIAATDAALQRRHTDPAACPACDYVKGDHYAPCARCGHSLYDGVATEARARVDAAQYGLTVCRDTAGQFVEFSHHAGQVVSVR